VDLDPVKAGVTRALRRPGEGRDHVGNFTRCDRACRTIRAVAFIEWHLFASRLQHRWPDRFRSIGVELRKGARMHKLQHDRRIGLVHGVNDWPPGVGILAGRDAGLVALALIVGEVGIGAFGDDEPVAPARTPCNGRASAARLCHRRWRRYVSSARPRCGSAAKRPRSWWVARELGFSVNWTAKHIDRLEAHLGVTLLQRTTRRIRLTEAGALCYDMSARLIDDADDLEARLGQSAVSPKGLIKVSAPASWAICELGPIVARFAKAYSGIKLEISLNDRFVDVIEEGFDFAIRLSNTLPDSRLLVRKLGIVRRIACAAPSYLEASGTPQVPQDLMAHTCLVFSLLSQRNTWPFKSPSGEAIELHPQARLTVNNSLLIRSALIAGTGIALIPDFIVREDIASGALVAILTDFEWEPFGIFIVRPADRRLPRRAGLFIDFLTEALHGAPLRANANSSRQERFP
jgi:DNA-binding transcriptional LysR family regulator